MASHNRGTKKRSSSSSKSKLDQMINCLPKSLSKDDLAKSASLVLEQVGGRAQEFQQYATFELGKFLARAYGAKDEVEKQTKQGLKQLVKKWNGNKGKLPLPETLTHQVDQLIERLGLKEQVKRPKPKAKPVAKPAARKPAPRTAKKPARSTATPTVVTPTTQA